MGQPSSTQVVVRSREVLARHARSFWWASAFLPASARDDAAVVYAFCRLVDDLADESPSPEEARSALMAVRGELLGARPGRPVVRAFREVMARSGGDVAAAAALLDGVLGDLEPVRLPDDRALLRYCYRVAGTVGLMMCGVLGVTAEAAIAHAIDLGVAMQITNICRDVREDAVRGRVYLPATRLAAQGLTPDDLLGGAPDRERLAAVVSDLLDLADRYYDSGAAGLAFIPLRTRAAIAIAARVYRRIGVRLRAHGCDAWRGRTVVSMVGKGWETVRALGALALPRARRDHDAALHVHLVGLPGANIRVRVAS